MTGRFTGRPKDRFIVHEDITRETVDWNAINQPIEPKCLAYQNDYYSMQKIFTRDAFVVQTKTIALLYG